jgi:hypothetical protein
MLPHDPFQAKKRLVGALLFELLERSLVGAKAPWAAVHCAALEIFARTFLVKKSFQWVVVRLHQAGVANEPMPSINCLEVFQNTHVCSLKARCFHYLWEEGFREAVDKVGIK